MFSDHSRELISETPESSDDFVRRLRDLRLWVGQPSLRRLQQLAGKAQAANGDEIDALPRSTVSNILRGTRVPRSDFVEAFVSACLKHRGSAESEIAVAVEEWLTVWRQLSATATRRKEFDVCRDEPAPVDQPNRQAGAVTAPPQQLPASPPTLVGREFDLAVLDMQRERRGCTVPVTVVSGMAGVGKTALAVWWARRIAGRFPDGQIHLDLRGSRPNPMRPEQALTILLRGLGMADGDIPSDIESQIGSYRSLLADRRVLIVLDDVLDTAQVRPLLPGDSQCLAVITSRNRLSGLVARDGAHRLLLAPLSPAASRRVLAQAVGRELGAADVEALDEIARLCMHLPLALRIAGATLADRPHQDVRAYAAEFGRGDRMTALAIDGDEHDTVRGAFDASCRLLAPRAQRLLCILGLAGRTEVSVENSAELGGIGVDEARRLLNQIAAENLIEPAVRDRYVLCDLLLDYARERAETEGITLPPASTASSWGHQRAPHRAKGVSVGRTTSPVCEDARQLPLDGQKRADREHRPVADAAFAGHERIALDRAFEPHSVLQRLPGHHTTVESAVAQPAEHRQPFFAASATLVPLLGAEPQQRRRLAERLDDE